MQIEGTKTVKAWSEAHAVKILCEYLNKKDSDLGLEWQEIARDMLAEELETFKGEDGSWVEKGRGTYAYGSTHPEYGHRFRLEMLNVEEENYQLKVEFYISINL